MSHNFLQNKYSKIYFNIINRASNREIDDYTENHHIVPKCLGGTNDKYNLVRLTAREHFICHLLLVRMVEDVKSLTSLRFALVKFRQSNSRQKRKILNSWEFEQVKKAQAEASKISNTGRKMPPMSDERRLKISNALKGRPSPMRGKKGATFGKQLSIEHRLKISKGNTGKKMNLSEEERSLRRDRLLSIRHLRIYNSVSDETKEKISKANKGQTPPNKGIKADVFICEHCGKSIGGKNNLLRWHSDNCRFKP